MQEWVWPFPDRNCWLSLLLFLNRALIWPGQTSLVFHLTLMQWLVLPEAPYAVFVVGWGGDLELSLQLYYSALDCQEECPLCAELKNFHLSGEGKLTVFSAIWAAPVFSWNPVCIRELCALEFVWQVHCSGACYYGLPIQDRWEGLHRTTSSINMFFQWFKECEFEPGLR